MNKTMLVIVVYVFQGPNASQLEKELAVDQFPINEHFIGLVNVRTVINYLNLISKCINYVIVLLFRCCKVYIEFMDSFVLPMIPKSLPQTLLNQAIRL